jgi:hypothetical protein
MDFSTMNTKTATQLLAEMDALQAALRLNQITIFVCACCGKVALARSQPALVLGREPITQIECHELGCDNHMQTVSYRTSDAEAYEQAIMRYTPVTMQESQVARFVDAIEFLAQSA